jgi:hypothetical protein
MIMIGRFLFVIYAGWQGIGLEIAGGVGIIEVVIRIMRTWRWHFLN